MRNMKIEVENNLDEIVKTLEKEIKMKTEREIFKQAYLNLRTSDGIPFPDAVFDEYVRLRDSEGYKLVPVEPTERMLDSAYSSISDNLHYADLENIYKAMIGASE